MSNMQIEIINVSMEVKPTKVAGKTYDLFDVAFKNKSFQDKVEGKKIPGFVSPQVTEALKTATFGDKFTVVREKDGEFWKWVQLIPEGGAVPYEVEPQPVQGTSMQPKATPSPKSTYETPEERAVKQVMIVRQSSISSAIAMLAAANDKKTPINPDTVIDVAKHFEAFVMGKEHSNNVFANMDEDVV